MSKEVRVKIEGELNPVSVVTAQLLECYPNSTPSPMKPNDRNQGWHVFITVPVKVAP